MTRTSRIPGRTLLTRDDFRALTRPIIGMPISHTWRGAGSAIFLELGALSTVTRKSPKGGEYTSTFGEVTFMLEWSWRVERAASIEFGSWSRNPRITRGVASLVGHTIIDLHVEGRLPELVVALDGQRWVHTFMTHEGQPEWAIRLHNTWVGVDRGRLIRQGPRPRPSTPG